MEPDLNLVPYIPPLKMVGFTERDRNYSDEVPPNYTGAVEYYHGLREYYLNGKLHRTDGPAVECDSDPSWNAYYILGEKTYKEAVEVFNWLFPEGPPQK